MVMKVNGSLLLFLFLIIIEFIVNWGTVFDWLGIRIIWIQIPKYLFFRKRMFDVKAILTIMGLYS